MAGISTDPLYSTALLQAEMFIPFDLLSDLDRRMLQEWDLLNTKERDGIAVPAVFAIGTGRTVLARSVDTMMHQIHPLEFLKTAESETRRPGRRLRKRHRLTWSSQAVPPQSPCPMLVG